MPSVIEIYHRTQQNKKNTEGDVLGLIRVMYPDVEYNSDRVKMLLNTKAPTEEKIK